jgi:hypothetical protein
MTPLYKLASEYVGAASRLSDTDLDAQTISDTLDGMSGEFEAKAVGVCSVIRNLESLADQIKNAETDMASRRKAIENRAASLRAYLLSNMQIINRNKIESPLFNISVRDNPEHVVINCEADLPADYMREIPASYSPDKVQIKKAIKEGFIVPGASLSRTVSLSIK